MGTFFSSLRRKSGTNSATNHSKSGIRVVETSGSPTIKEIAQGLKVTTQNQEGLESKIGSVEVNMQSMVTCHAQDMDATNKLKEEIIESHDALKGVGVTVQLAVDELPQNIIGLNKEVKELQANNKKVSENIRALNQIVQTLNYKTKPSVDCKTVSTIVLLTFVCQFVSYYTLLASAYMFGS